MGKFNQILPARMNTWTSIFALFLASFARAQTPTTKGESLDTVLVANDIPDDKSFRCGIFFAGKKLGDKPRLKIYILPKRWEATCDAPKPEEYKKFCYDLFEGFSKFVGWDSPSRRDPEGGRTIGDDLCRLLRKRAGFRKLPNKKFPEGVEVGFYYNSCEDKKWYDTEFRLPPNICCDGDLFVDCPAK